MLHHRGSGTTFPNNVLIHTFTAQAVFPRVCFLPGTIRTDTRLQDHLRLRVLMVHHPRFESFWS
jgi:hypothetical protein